MRDQNCFIYMIRPYRARFMDTMTENEEKIMDEHFEYLKALFREKKVILAGPCLDSTFGLVVYTADSKEEAQEIMNHDPSITAGIMKAELHPFRISLLQTIKESKEK